jgi:hypothetical protein
MAIVKQPARAVVLALIALGVVATTLFGVLDDLPDWLRGLIQAGGTLAGVYLGSMLQFGDQRYRLEAVGDSAVSHLAAIAKSITLIIDHIADVRSSMANGSQKTIATVQSRADSALNGIDVQLRGVLTQAEAAAQDWRPYSPNFLALTRTQQGADEGRNKL